MIQEEARNRRPQDRHRRVGRQEQCERPRLLALGKPTGQIQDDSREITCFSQPQKKAQNVQLMDSVHEAGQRRYNSPANQYSSDPDPRSDFMQEQIAGDFKDEVAEKENPEDQSELLAGDGQLSVHGQRRKPNIVAIEYGNDEK